MPPQFNAPTRCRPYGFAPVVGRIALLVISGASAVLAEPTHQFTPEANATCWAGPLSIGLLNGRDLAGWSKMNSIPTNQGWEVADGGLHRIGSGGDLYFTAFRFVDFDLRWEWKIAPGGNSGVKYKVRQFDGVWLGCEYQLLDDDRHENGRNPKTSAGALYGVWPPAPTKTLRPVGEYNESRVVVCGCRIEHWLNGQRILNLDTRSQEWKERVSRSKFADRSGFGQNRAGFIMLQDHGDEVWFRHIELRPL